MHFHKSLHKKNNYLQKNKLLKHKMKIQKKKIIKGNKKISSIKTLNLSWTKMMKLKFKHLNLKNKLYLNKSKQHKKWFKNLKLIKGSFKKFKY